MQKKSDILKYLRSKKDELSSMYGITTLGLYGSYARDEANDKSDIDIFYDTNNKFNMGILEFSKLKQSFENDLKAKIDFVSLSSMNPIVKYYAKKDFAYV